MEIDLKGVGPTQTPLGSCAKPYKLKLRKIAQPDQAGIPTPNENSYKQWA